MRGSIVTSVDFEKSMNGSEWFLDLIEFISKFEREHNTKITDVYIREDAPVSLGILKSFFPVPPSLIKSKSKEEIITLTKNLYRLYILSGGKFNPEEELLEGILKKSNLLSFSIAIEGVGVLRAMVSMSVSGLTLTIRLLSFVIPSIAMTKIPNSIINAINKRMTPLSVFTPFGVKIDVMNISKGGLIIHCGPTGSGKTTAIASVLDYIASKLQGMIITYEDPVEYRFITRSNVIQYDLSGDFLKREEIYHHFLRSTAQVCFVGEVKTREEIREVIDLSARGHLVFTTMHANGVVEALYVLLNNTENYTKSVLLSSIFAIIYQELTLDKEGKITPAFEYLVFEEVPAIKALRSKLSEDYSYQKVSSYLSAIDDESIYTSINRYKLKLKIQ